MAALLAGVHTTTQAQPGGSLDTLECHIIGFNVGPLVPSARLSHVSLASGGTSQDATMASARTNRTTKFSIISAYLMCERMGWKEPLRKQLFEAYPKLTMTDLVNFQQKYIKNQKKTIMLLGKESDIDFNALSKYGKVKKLTLDEIFGY